MVLRDRNLKNQDGRRTTLSMDPSLKLPYICFEYKMPHSVYFLHHYLAKTDTNIYNRLIQIMSKIILFLFIDRNQSENQEQEK